MTQAVKHSKDDAPLVSVVIPSYNGARYIRRCLQALFSQSTGVPFEVILVDSSDDGTDQIVAEEFSQVRLFHFQQRRTVGAARNIGVDNARGEAILFLDTDCIVDPTWVDQMYAAIQSLGADGVGGSVKNGTPWSITGCVGFYLEFFRFLAYDGKPYATPFLVGGNCGFRRDVFKITRYTDQSVGDDVMFNWQLVDQGKRLLFLPSVSVEHINKTGLAAVLHYQYKLGLGACAYRYCVSPGVMRILERLPLLVLLMPVGIMPWIACVVLKRRGILEFLKFVALLPMLFISNCVWAAGFYRELMNRRGKPFGSLSRSKF